MHADKILIIDFGSQYTKLIARKVRECRVYSEIIPCTADFSKVDKNTLKGVILSGGPASVFVNNAPAFSKQILDLNVPILGICYGLQLLSHHFKGEVTSGRIREYGKTKICPVKKSVLFDKINNEFTVWMSHSDHIKRLPKQFEITSKSQNGLISSFENVKNKICNKNFIHFQIS